ncbi:MAG: hypothetical protein ACXWC7_13410, partial [Chitinophagaceae bacterium]
KSGYYYLSKELNCPIRVMGPDFERKTLEILPLRGNISAENSSVENSSVESPSVESFSSNNKEAGIV